MPFPPSPKISRHPSLPVLCSCSPETSHLWSKRPVQHGFPGVLCLSPMALTPWGASAHLCSLHTPLGHVCPTAAAPHHGGCPISPAPLPVTCPAPNTPRPLPKAPLPMGRCAPSPSTAYHIFGKTCCPRAPRCCKRPRHSGAGRGAGEAGVPGRRGWLPTRVQRHPPATLCCTPGSAGPGSFSPATALPPAAPQLLERDGERATILSFSSWGATCSRDFHPYLPLRHKGFYFKGTPDTTSRRRCHHCKQRLSPATAS